MLPLFLFAICRVPDVFLHSVGQQQPDGITDVTDHAIHCFTPFHIVTSTPDIGQPQYSQAPDESPVLMEPLDDANNAVLVCTSAASILFGPPLQTFDDITHSSAVVLIGCGGFTVGTQLATVLSIAGNLEQGAVCRNQSIHLRPYQLPCLLELYEVLEGLNLRSTVSYESPDEHHNFAYLLKPGPRGFISQESHKFMISRCLVLPHLFENGCSGTRVPVCTRWRYVWYGDR